MRELNSTAENTFDDISRLERELKGKLDKWANFEESSAAFSRWLKEVQDTLKSDMILKATLDEKKAQLQSYRNLLQDIKSQRPVLDDLLERSQQLPEVSEATREFISTSQSAHHGLQEKAQAFVEAYEAAVANHQQYMKAVMELGEWMTATHNTIEMWSDASLERLSLHANLERIKSMQMTLPEEEPRITAVQGFGEKVIPGTVQSGQVNVRAQIDSSQQEWQGLASTIQLAIDSLEQKIQQWAEFETGMQFNRLLGFRVGFKTTSRKNSI